MLIQQREPIKLRVTQEAGKWHAQVIRLQSGEVYDSAPLDLREDAVAAAQSLIDNVLPEGTTIQFE